MTVIGKELFTVKCSKDVDAVRAACLEKIGDTRVIDTWEDLEEKEQAGLLEFREGEMTVYIID